MDEADVDPLLAAYLEHRQELLRYFRARLRSEEAAEDLVQEIYLKIERRPAEEIGAPAAYLFRLGSNLMLDRIKQERRVHRRAAAWRETRGDSSGGELASEDAAADDVVSAKQRLEQIITAVRSLPPSVQEAFRLHKLQGLTHAETARAMKVSRSTVEKYMMTALKHILDEVGR